MHRKYSETSSDYMKQEYEELMTNHTCHVCGGSRLKAEALSIKLGGKNIAQITDMSVLEIRKFFKNLELTDTQKAIGKQILKEINARIGFLVDVGLDYLTLSRMAGTLSGGEAQRIRLATQIGSGLVGVIYILDEPSIGLHQRDNSKLLRALVNLRDLGNTLIVVEHDEETMYAADYIVDIGPFAGSRGGVVVSTGNVEDIKKSLQSEPGAYLSGRKKIGFLIKEESPMGNTWRLKTKENNLEY